MRFEVFTLGTLGVIIGVAVIAYLLGAPVRNREATAEDLIRQDATPGGTRPRLDA
jgi:hypothetical protein